MTHGNQTSHTCIECTQATHIYYTSKIGAHVTSQMTRIGNLMAACLFRSLGRKHFKECKEWQKNGFRDFIQGLSNENRNCHGFFEYDKKGVRKDAVSWRSDPIADKIWDLRALFKCHPNLIFGNANEPAHALLYKRDLKLTE